jgi:hypothetical protein
MYKQARRHSLKEVQPENLRESEKDTPIKKIPKNIYPRVPLEFKKQGMLQKLSDEETRLPHSTIGAGALVVAPRHVAKRLRALNQKGIIKILQGGQDAPRLSSAQIDDWIRRYAHGGKESWTYNPRGFSATPESLRQDPFVQQRNTYTILDRIVDPTKGHGKAPATPFYNPMRRVKLVGNKKSGLGAHVQVTRNPFVAAHEIGHATGKTGKPNLMFGLRGAGMLGGGILSFVGLRRRILNAAQGKEDDGYKGIGMQAGGYGLTGGVIMGEEARANYHAKKLLAKEMPNLKGANKVFRNQMIRGYAIPLALGYGASLLGTEGAIRLIRNYRANKVNKGEELPAWMKPPEGPKKPNWLVRAFSREPKTAQDLSSLSPK